MDKLENIESFGWGFGTCAFFVVCLLWWVSEYVGTTPVDKKVDRLLEIGVACDRVVISKDLKIATVYISPKHEEDTWLRNNEAITVFNHQLFSVRVPVTVYFMDHQADPPKKMDRPLLRKEWINERQEYRLYINDISELKIE